MESYQDISVLFEGSLDSKSVTTDPEICAHYKVDGLAPKAVVYPSSVQEVSSILKIAHQKGLCVVPWGGGSKMGLGYPPSKLDLVLVTSKLNKVVDLDPGNLTFTAQAGIPVSAIQQELRGQENRCYLPSGSDDLVCSEREYVGCFIPMDPPFSTQATLGGVIATASSGPRHFFYGHPRDMVLGIRFVAPDGSIIRAGGKTVKNVSGYDVSKLMIGSLGSLGIICEITFRLLPLPEEESTLIFTCPAAKEAARLAWEVLGSKLPVAAIEIFNQAVMSKCGDSGFPKNPHGTYYVALALEGNPQAVERMKGDSMAMGRSLGLKEPEVIEGKEQQKFWLNYGDVHKQGKGKEGLTTRFSYPISRLATAVEAFDELGTKPWKDAHELYITVHGGNGISRVSWCPDGNRQGLSDKLKKWLSEITHAVKSINGNFVVERAPVQWKQGLSIWGFPRPYEKLMKRIKQRLDPKGIMSPGRLC